MVNSGENTPRTAGKPYKDKRISLGDALIKVVSPNGVERYLFRPRFKGKKIELSFKAPNVTEARKRVIAYRAQMIDGIDPRAVKRAAKAEATGSGTFRAVAEEVYDARKTKWRSDAHAAQWWDSIFKDCPALLDMQVAAITTADVLATLKPLYARSFTAGKRTRERIALVLEGAMEKGLIPADRRNAADIKTLLPQAPDIEKKHHKGLHYREVPALFESLKGRGGVASECLQFLYLTGARSKQARSARWDEFKGLDGDEPVWIKAGENMKRGRTHRIPLSPQAVAIVKDRYKKRLGDWVFPGEGKEGCISNSALHGCLDRHIDDKEITVHGSRGSFRGWLDEVRDVSMIRARQALSHKVGNDTDGAYLLTDGLEARRADIEAWGRYCVGATADVIPLHKTTA